MIDVRGDGDVQRPRSYFGSRKSRPKKQGRFKPLGLELVALLAMALVIWWLFTPPPDWVEAHYSRKVYPWLASKIVPLTSSVQLSISALLLLALPMLWLISLVVRFWHVTLLSWLFNGVWQLLVLCISLAASFVLLWGANYQREPIESQFALQVGPSSQADLEQFSSALLELIKRDSTAVRDTDKAMRAIGYSLAKLVEDTTGVYPTLPEKAKRLPKGLLLILGSASGVMSPWTLEPHVEGALPDVTYLAVAAHELAHVAGYAGEADADFVAALAGLKADDAFARYAVALRLYQEAVVQLPVDEQKAFNARLPEPARTDWEEALEAYNRYQPPKFIRDFQRRSYDSYLKSQGVTQGIADYSRTISLLLAAQKQGLVF
jgi:hypothetical protein